MRTEDGHIISKCLNGEPEAFGFLVDKYKGAIYAFAYAKLRNFHDAEDVTQEVFVKAYEKLRSLRRWDSFHAWLYAITSNFCKNWIRARSNRPDCEFVEDQSLKALTKPAVSSYRESLARGSLYESLYEAVDSLPEMYSEVLTLYYLGGMSNKEIARFLGTSPATVRQRLTRARSQLKEEMLAMMSTTFEEQRLQASFTFRIVEAVKRIKIHAMPRMTGLPWGLSLATGIILTVMSISPYLSFLNPASLPMSSALPSAAKALKTGEIPVDILKISQMPVLASKQGDDDGGEPELPDPQKALLMAPHGEMGKWTKRADMPTARCPLNSASTVDGKIYVIGGGLQGAGPGPGLRTVEEYDPATDTWTKRADMPTAREWLSTSVVNGMIYAIGGSNDVTLFSTVEEYDPATNKWRKRADMPTARSLLSTSAVNGKIYAIGGTDGIVALSVVEEYDPSKDKWIKKADMPTARHGFSTSAVNGKIYATGGQVGGWGPGGGAIVSTVEEYDPVKGAWKRKAKMPTARSGLSTSVVNGKIYAIGGISDIFHSTVEEYSPATDTWTAKANMPTARTDLSTSAVDGKIYAIGGSSSWPLVPLSTVEEYDTGFVPPQKETRSVEAKGKIVKPWGEIKSD